MSFEKLDNTDDNGAYSSYKLPQSLWLMGGKNINKRDNFSDFSPDNLVISS